ncbi:unnamed protein product [Phytophthora fragariaefolia]|uniref:Unnamed protein product n=1 Tax=Phytophthora fragariaefolia TaxID=1490495 RepID=A0A9W6XBL7_9STRA|nr:unnamed protein product [Phytophthora fragariaefolia]
MVLGFKLHCSSELAERLTNVISAVEMERISAITKKSSDIRTHVFEVTSMLKGSRRIVNTDNFYTSCLLLESLRTLGLYGRGTVRSSSKHFPCYAMLTDNDARERGCMRQEVCIDKHIVATSWVDGSIVKVISNADDSGTATVYRRIKQERIKFVAPKCKWHMMEALAMVGIAHCNAYVCHRLVLNEQLSCDEENLDNGGNYVALNTRDKQRSFVAVLARETFDET